MAKVLQRKSYSAGWFNMEEQRIELNNGAIIHRNVVMKGEASVVLTIHREKGNVILTKEYRAGSASYELGFPAGMIDAGETPEDAAIREVREESGYTVKEIKYLGHAFASTGWCTEKVHYFVATVEGEPEELKLDHDEFLEIVEVPYQDIPVYIAEGKIVGNHAHACMLKYMFLSNN